MHKIFYVVVFLLAIFSLPLKAQDQVFEIGLMDIYHPLLVSEDKIKLLTLMSKSITINAYYINPKKKTSLKINPYFPIPYLTGKIYYKVKELPVNSVEIIAKEGFPAIKFTIKNKEEGLNLNAVKININYDFMCTFSPFRDWFKQNQEKVVFNNTSSYMNTVWLSDQEELKRRALLDSFEKYGENIKCEDNKFNRQENIYMVKSTYVEDIDNFEFKRYMGETIYELSRADIPIDSIALCKNKKVGQCKDFTFNAYSQIYLSNLDPSADTQGKEVQQGAALSSTSATYPPILKFKLDVSKTTFFSTKKIENDWFIIPNTCYESSDNMYKKMCDLLDKPSQDQDISESVKQEFLKAFAEKNKR